LHDDRIWRPIWLQCRTATLRGLAIALVWCIFSYAPTKLVRQACTARARNDAQPQYVRYFVKKAALSAYDDESRVLGVNVVLYATLTFLLGQASMIVEYILSRQLKKARADVYEATVVSRGKDASFWTPYCEEWLVPPTERARRAAGKASWYGKLASPLVRMLVVKGVCLRTPMEALAQRPAVCLTPLAFIPFLGMVRLQI
jgi:hypothetical protein